MKKSNGELIPINYEADPMGFIHIINAYEENDHIFVDAPFKSTAIDYRYILKYKKYKIIYPEFCSFLAKDYWILKRSIVYKKMIQRFKICSILAESDDF